MSDFLANKKSDSFRLKNFAFSFPFFIFLRTKTAALRRVDSSRTFFSREIVRRNFGEKMREKWELKQGLEEKRWLIYAEGWFEKGFE